MLAKKVAGKAAADLIQDGMLVGLGSGSTAAFFIEALGKRCQMGLKISAVAASQESSYQAQRLGIPICNPDDVVTVDLTVDGADEIDHDKNMIKGGGGALLREKLLAQASKELIIIVDEKKIVDRLGKHPVAVEIIPFIYHSTLKCLNKLGYQGVLRLSAKKEPFVTDNGNYIFDIQYSHFILDPQKEQKQLKSIIGVVETGIFFDFANRIIIGYENGNVKVRT